VALRMMLGAAATNEEMVWLIASPPDAARLVVDAADGPHAAGDRCAFCHIQGCHAGLAIDVPSGY